MIGSSQLLKIKPELSCRRWRVPNNLRIEMDLADAGLDISLVSTWARKAQHNCPLLVPSSLETSPLPHTYSVVPVGPVFPFGKGSPLTSTKRMLFVFPWKSTGHLSRGLRPNSRPLLVLDFILTAVGCQAGFGKRTAASSDGSSAAGHPGQTESHGLVLPGSLNVLEGTFLFIGG